MILIRADANEKIGTGHIMRCLSLARTFAEKHEEVVFITADHNGDDLISEFRIICLDTEWYDMDSEIGKMISIIRDTCPIALLVDSYFVTQRYFESLSGITKVAYIDDVNKACWDVRFLINYNIYGKILNYSAYKKKATKLLLGMQYAPLRAEFKNRPSHFIRGEIKDILVSAGGADPEGVVEQLIREICPMWNATNFHFVIGALNSRIDEIKKLENGNIILHINEQHMSDLMENCDVAISAAGTTLYELCSIGVPTITYVLADNQLLAATQFHKDGIMINAGDCREDNGFMVRIQKKLETLSYGTRKNMSQKMQSLVDGRGTERIVNAIIKEV